MYRTGVISVGFAVPDHTVTNSDLLHLTSNFNADTAGTSLDEWVMSHYGIKERRWLTNGELPSDIATKACQNALDKVSQKADEIDLLILNTAFGDYSQPTTATAVQRKLGMRANSVAIEVNMPCSGPVYGMTIADAFIKSGIYKTVMVVGVDKMSSLVDMTDFRMAALFGDGAGACLLSRVDKGGIMASHLASKGEEGEAKDFALVIPGGRSANPTSTETVLNKQHFLYMRGQKVEQFIAESFKDSITTLLAATGLQPNDIHFVVPHQASKGVIIKNTRINGFPDEKVQFSLEQYGNTSSASILVTLAKLYEQGVKNGDKLMLIGMGGGLNWGGLVYEHWDY